MDFRSVSISGMAVSMSQIGSHEPGCCTSEAQKLKEQCHN